MQKRYQVFVSSTYTDLVAERAGVIESLLRLNCFPASMEIFGAASTPPWNIIKDTIDLCDYFIVVSAGKYGSLTQEGVSYTQKEYEYAREAGKSCLAFIHHDLSSLSGSHLEVAEDARKKLRKFHEGLKQSLLCEHYEDTNDLKYKVFSSLHAEISRNPQAGWIRSTEAADPEVYKRLAEVQEALARAEAQLREAPNSTKDAEVLRRSVATYISPAILSRGVTDATALEEIAKIDAFSIFIELVDILDRLGSSLYAGATQSKLHMISEKRLRPFIEEATNWPLDTKIGSRFLISVVTERLVRQVLLFLEAEGLLDTEPVERGISRGLAVLREIEYRLNERGRRLYARAAIGESGGGEEQAE